MKPRTRKKKRPTTTSTQPAQTLDQTLFLVDAKRYDAFVAMLENPPAVSSALLRTMNAPAPWGKG